MINKSRWKILLLYRPDDLKGDIKIGLFRLVLLLGIGLFWLAVNDSIQHYPGIEHAEISKGILLKVSNTSGRLSGGRLITVEVNGEEKMFESFSIVKTKFLENEIGKDVTIWSYPHIHMFFIIKRNRVIEIEIDNAKILNDWVQVKEMYESRSSLPWFISGVFLVFLSALMIFKLASNAVRSDQT